MLIVSDMMQITLKAIPIYTNVWIMSLRRVCKFTFKPFQSQLMAFSFTREGILIGRWKATISSFTRQLSHSLSIV